TLRELWSSPPSETNLADPFDSTCTVGRFSRRPLALASRIPSSRLIPNVLQSELYFELSGHNGSLFGCEDSNYLRHRPYFQLHNLTQDRCLLIANFLQTIAVRNSEERKFAQLLISHCQRSYQWIGSDFGFSNYRDDLELLLLGKIQFVGDWSKDLIN